ncbi:protoporphyrinogen oxidase HemJ [Peteryoungia desertarenae]|uniref:Protoporphyrinogen IX oxidase n=1 Tax=Peteryoungia desertarenae TaxID=1813451 RepID=A0ABX6QJX0_9HYPH|nr:protoporphyrinogen oxidase HemJ [Peteryoungia desertarenae]QLF68858.1 protoporphyrinogen oxidase HemJ [Peteryoungia desertarenae]
MAGQIAASEGRKAARKAASALVFFGAIALAIMIFGEAEAYPWIKALHVIAVISWMAGMLYLPRLFIYHCDAPVGSDQAKTFAVMESRLMGVIMTPAMVVSWILGLYLAWTVYGFMGGWLHAKLAAVFLLSGVHGYFARAVKEFGAGRYVKNPRYWRMVNEIPTVLMILAVVFVIVKPF